MARFVAESLVGQLLDRGDILAGDIPEIRRIVDQRIEDGALTGDSLAEKWEQAGSSKAKAVVDIDDLQPGDGKEPAETAEDKVRAMDEAGTLDAEVVGKAFDDGDVETAIAALASLSGLPAALIEKASEEGDPTTIIAICDVAALPATMLVPAQRALGGISLGDTIKPEGASYPLDKNAMQLALAALQETG